MNNQDNHNEKNASIDYIIVGQGLSGTFLSYNLMKAGKRVLVIDKSKPFTASKVASGVINPVTGRRIVKTWRIEELLPYSLLAYKELELKFNVSLIRQSNVLDFHPTLQMKEAFEKRRAERADYLIIPKDIDQWNQYFNFRYGAGEINPCYLIDINTLLDNWRRHLKLDNNLLEDEFLVRDCLIEQDGVRYQNISARKIIFCDGVEGFDNPFFKNLPYSRMKGEVIIAEIKDLPKTNIYKQGFSIVPWKDDLFWIGSSYEWNFSDVLPTAAFEKKVNEQLKYFLKLPYTIVEHLASERPANMERRPFVGVHPIHQSVAIFNGMGTKGCSLAPFFAKQLADNLLYSAPIYPDANVARFEKVLQRNIN